MPNVREQILNIWGTVEPASMRNCSCVKIDSNYLVHSERKEVTGKKPITTPQIEDSLSVGPNREAGPNPSFEGKARPKFRQLVVEVYVVVEMLWRIKMPPLNRLLPPMSPGREIAYARVRVLQEQAKPISQAGNYLPQQITYQPHTSFLVDLSC